MAVGLILDDLPPALARVRDEPERRGRTAVAVGWDGRYAGCSPSPTRSRRPAPRPYESCARSGSHRCCRPGTTVRWPRPWRRRSASTRWSPKCCPRTKVAVVKRLQDEGRVLAMVGDGADDARRAGHHRPGPGDGYGRRRGDRGGRSDAGPRGSAGRGGRDPAVPADPGDDQGHPLRAFGPNVAALPPAAAGLLNPMLAGAAMAFSSVFVVTNSLRLRTFRLTCGEVPGSYRRLEPSRNDSPPGVRREPHISSSQGSRSILTLGPRSPYPGSCACNGTYARDTDHSDVNVTIEGVRRSKLTMSGSVLGGAD